MQKTGTLAWELAVIRAHGLDKQARLDIVTLELASAGGRQDRVARRLGRHHRVGLAVGVARAPSRRKARVLSLFQRGRRRDGGRRVAVDKSRRSQGQDRSRSRAVRSTRAGCCCRARLKQDGIDLKTQATRHYGAPALLAEKTLQGEFDATLNYWNFSAALEAKGMRRLASIADILPRLGAKGSVAMIGYVFDDAWAAQNRGASSASST